MRELEVPKSGAHFFPEAKHAEAFFPNLRVVKQHNGVVRQLVRPRHKIMLDVFVKMPAVNVQQIDCARRKLINGFVEGRANQAGKSRIVRIMIPAEFVKNVLAIQARVLVTLPGIDRKTLCIEVEALNALTKAGVGKPMVRSEFNDALGPMRLNQPECEWSVLRPSRKRDQVRSLKGRICHQIRRKHARTAFGRPIRQGYRARLLGLPPLTHWQHRIFHLMP